MIKSIEAFLGLTPENIKERTFDILKLIPTRPGTGYINERLKEFKAQPWPFIIHMAYWNPDALEDRLSAYAAYDGNESRAVIMEKLREYYILGRIAYEATKMEKNRANDTGKYDVNIDDAAKNGLNP
jgi:hypothetical protein